MKDTKIVNNPLVNYENRWVALTLDRKTVLSFGNSVKELDRKLKTLKQKKVIITKVFPFDCQISPFNV
jgi:hypothetical protein